MTGLFWFECRTSHWVGPAPRVCYQRWGIVARYRHQSLPTERSAKLVAPITKVGKVADYALRGIRANRSYDQLAAPEGARGPSGVVRSRDANSQDSPREQPEQPRLLTEEQHD